jgi:hypothetical protein
MYVHRTELNIIQVQCDTEEVFSSVLIVRFNISVFGNA